MTTTINTRSTHEASSRVESAKTTGSARDVAAGDSGTDFLATLLGRLDAPRHDKPQSTQPRTVARAPHTDDKAALRSRTDRPSDDRASANDSVSGSSAPSKSRVHTRRSADRDDPTISEPRSGNSSATAQSVQAQRDSSIAPTVDTVEQASTEATSSTSVASNAPQSASDKPAVVSVVTEPVAPSATTGSPAAMAEAVSGQATLPASDEAHTANITDLDATLPTPAEQAAKSGGSTAPAAVAQPLTTTKAETPVTVPGGTAGEATATAITAPTVEQDNQAIVVSVPAADESARVSDSQAPSLDEAAESSSVVKPTEQGQAGADSTELEQGPEAPKILGTVHTKTTADKSADFPAVQQVPVSTPQTPPSTAHVLTAVKVVEPATESPAPVTTSAIAPTASTSSGPVSAGSDAPAFGKPVVATPTTFVATVAPHIAAMRRLNSGDHELRVLMRPHELGEVSVSVRLIDGAVHVSMDGALASTRDLLRDSLASLRTALTDAGVNVGSTDIGSGAFQGGDPKGESRTGSASATSTESRSGTTQTSSLPRTITRARPGGIDVLA